MECTFEPADSHSRVAVHVCVSVRAYTFLSFHVTVYFFLVTRAQHVKALRQLSETKLP